MPQCYHFSVSKSNTKAIHICDVVASMGNAGEMTVGQRLKMARRQAQMTQHQLAAVAKVAQSAIGNIEAGTRGFGSSVLPVARALGVDPHWLATGEGEMRGASIDSAMPAIVGTATASVGQPPPSLEKALEVLVFAFADTPDSTRNTVATLVASAVKDPKGLADCLRAIEALRQYSKAKMETAAISKVKI